MESDEVKEIKRRLELIKRPIDKDQLVADGILRKKGRSYYVVDMKNLPEEVSLKIKGISQTPDGIRVSFR